MRSSCHRVSRTCLRNGCCVPLSTSRIERSRGTLSSRVCSSKTQPRCSAPKLRRSITTTCASVISDLTAARQVSPAQNSLAIRKRPSGSRLSSISVSCRPSSDWSWTNSRPKRPRNKTRSLPRLDRPGSKVRRSDQENIADVAPACGDQVHQPARPSAEPEDPQQQKTLRSPIECARKNPKSDDRHDFINDERQQARRTPIANFECESGAQQQAL